MIFIVKKIPITDNHLHLSENGRGIDAIRDFERAGGTHAIVVSLPSWMYGVIAKCPEDYDVGYEATLRMVERVNKETGVKAWAVVGVHPAELIKLKGRMKIGEAVEVMKGALERAQKLVVEGKCVGIKSGRPHWKVSEEEWELSCEVMEYAMRLAKEVDCPVQLHTEEATEEGISHIGSIAKKVGIPTHKVIKHYSPPQLEMFRKGGVFPSVLAVDGAVERALEQGDDFFIETDYMDDPKRPGAVLGPKTVPKRTLSALKEGYEDALWKIHCENVERAYNVEVVV